MSSVALRAERVAGVIRTRGLDFSHEDKILDELIQSDIASVKGLRHAIFHLISMAREENHNQGSDQLKLVIVKLQEAGHWCTQHLMDELDAE